MFRIRHVFGDMRPRDRKVVAQVQAILKSQFAGIADEEIDELPEILRNPFQHRLRYILLAADGHSGKVKGFALLAHAPDLKFCYLDYISTARRLTGGGIGGALYQRVREEARLLGTVGVFMECLPDDPALCSNPEVLKTNRARLRFYEQFGARPVINTAYETPLHPEDDCPPYLVFDGLERDVPLRRNMARKIVRAILERKYGSVCPEGYIDMVAASFRDDPVRVRPPRYFKPERMLQTRKPFLSERRIALVYSEHHSIHHVHEQGYVESPVRIKSILKELDRLPIFEKVQPRRFPLRNILSVHDHQMVNYFRRMCDRLEHDESVYPYVFPIRNAARPPKELPIRAGYFCIDTFTPLNRNAYEAARLAVDCTLTAADALLAGYRVAYALVRPPGHHAERKVFGGFCYFNSAAIAAELLSVYGRVAMIDVDYHHGNGTQDIFYERSDVLTISIHGHPNLAYPYFSGFRDEAGQGPGRGYNLNIPLGEDIDGPTYRRSLEKAFHRTTRFKPAFLVISLGLDTAKGDPTGSWSLEAKDFEANGRMIGALDLPTLIVQEGGYRIRSLGVNARHFFSGLWAGAGIKQEADSLAKT